jgi:hypothetical protein
MVPDAFAACAEQLAASPELVERLLREHAPDHVGLCRAHDAHPERHPCSIRTLAELAAERLNRMGT